MKRVALYTKNERLMRKFELILRSYAAVDVAHSDEDHVHASVVFIDCESYPELEKCGIPLPHEIKNGVIRNTPFLHSDLISIVNSSGTDKKERRLHLDRQSRLAYLGDEDIPLTEVEYKLLDTLMSAHGFIDKASLLSAVWGEGADPGVLAVYVHYLREKLESRGEKVIVTSRAHGYAIDERFREEM